MEMKNSTYDYLKKSPGSTLFFRQSLTLLYGAGNGTSREKPQIEAPGDERIPIQLLQDVAEGQETVSPFFHRMDKMAERFAREPAFDFGMNRQDMDSAFGKR